MQQAQGNHLNGLEVAVGWRVVMKNSGNVANGVGSSLIEGEVQMCTRSR